LHDECQQTEKISRKPKIKKLHKNIGGNMTRIAILFFVLTGGVAIGLVVLSNWQIPAPTTAIDKVIPNEKLPK